MELIYMLQKKHQHIQSFFVFHLEIYLIKMELQHVFQNGRNLMIVLLQRKQKWEEII